jgi:hypothetical protein
MRYKNRIGISYAPLIKVIEFIGIKVKGNIKWKTPNATVNKSTKQWDCHYPTE